MNKRLALLIAAAVAGLPTAARADRLDKQLFDEMPRVIRQLKEKKLHTVGVLRFRVEQAGRPATFEAPLSGSLATRVENLLIIQGGPEEKEAVGVIHDASRSASLQGVSRWADSKEQRRKLFDVKYRLAWGNRRVTADAFLTGTVQLSKDLKRTTLTLQYFDRSAPGELVTLARVNLNTDRGILRDLGYSFQLRKGALAARGREGLPIVIVEDTDEEQPGRRPPDPTTLQDTDTVTRPVNVGGVAVEMLAGGKVQTMTPRPGAADGVAWEVKCPPPGVAVQFRLRNQTDKRLSVVLRLNGINTINEQKAPPEHCGKWVLDGKKVATVKGVLMLGGAVGASNELLPIRVLVGEAAAKIRDEMGDRTGLIQVDVFADSEERPEVTVAPRGLPPSKDKEARASYVGLRDALIKSSGLKTQMVRSREVIGPDRSAPPPPGYADVKVLPTSGTRLVASVTIKVVPRGE